MATRVQLSNFSYVKRPKNQGNALRFTWAIRIDFPNDLFGELAIEGNIAFYKSDGTLAWSPPITKIGPVASIQCHWLNPTLYDIVLDLLREEKSLIKNLINPLNFLMEAKLVKNVDNTLPKLLERIEDEERPVQVDNS